MKRKILIAALILTSVILGIVIAHAQVNPQDQINALHIRINEDLFQWTVINAAKQRDRDNIHDLDMNSEALNQEIVISQESINSLQNAIASQENSDQYLDTEGTLNQIGT